VIALALILALPPSLLGAVCAYGPLETRFLVWRRERREVWKPYRA